MLTNIQDGCLDLGQIVRMLLPALSDERPWVSQPGEAERLNRLAFHSRQKRMTDP
jgi:hypothetical protein